MTLEELLTNYPNLTPEKREFLRLFANMPKTNNTSAMMRELNRAKTEANQKNIQFSKEEQHLVYELLTANLPPEEKQKVDRMMLLLEKFGMA